MTFVEPSLICTWALVTTPRSSGRWLKAPDRAKASAGAILVCDLLTIGTDIGLALTDIAPIFVRLLTIGTDIGSALTDIGAISVGDLVTIGTDIG